jgi:hypothetical protein
VKNPPTEYKKASGKGGIDILGELINMKAKVQAKSYKSQYEFTKALEDLVSPPWRFMTLPH